jgi:YidC/Oxa1 family membrane protein insertase
MDNQRLFLFIALSFIALMLWEAWQRDYGTPPPAATVETATPGPEGAPPAADLPVVAPLAPAATPGQAPVRLPGRRPWPAPRGSAW